jgi:hypothetical protein
LNCQKNVGNPTIFVVVEVFVQGKYGFHGTVTHDFSLNAFFCWLHLVVIRAKMFVFSVGNLVMGVVTRFHAWGLRFEVKFRFLVKHATLEASAHLAGNKLSR